MFSRTYDALKSWGYFQVREKSEQSHFGVRDWWTTLPVLYTINWPLQAVRLTPLKDASTHSTVNRPQPDLRLTDNPLIAYANVDLLISYSFYLASLFPPHFLSPSSSTLSVVPHRYPETYC